MYRDEFTHEVPGVVNRRLHRRLVNAANAAGLLDVAYRTIDTPVGSLLLAATPKGLVPAMRRVPAR